MSEHRERRVPWYLWPFHALWRLLSFVLAATGRLLWEKANGLAADPSGLGEERVRTFGPGSDEHPAWAPDNRHLVFVSSRGGGRGIFVMDVDSGRTRTVISDGGSCYGVTWSPVPGR